MSAKLFTKLGVQDMDEVIHSVNSIAGNRERGGFMMDHITSCNKVSNGVLLDEYRHNVDALNNSGALVSREKIQEEIVNPEEIEWLDTKVHLRRSSF